MFVLGLGSRLGIRVSFRRRVRVGVMIGFALLQGFMARICSSAGMLTLTLKSCLYPFRVMASWRCHQEQAKPSRCCLSLLPIRR